MLVSAGELRGNEILRKEKKHMYPNVPRRANLTPNQVG